MTGSLWIDNLITYNLQVGCLVFLAGALTWLLRLRHPRVLLCYWQLVLLAALLLPLIQPWRRQQIVIFTAGEALPLPSVPSVTQVPTAAEPAFSPLQIAVPLLLTGMVVRTLWLAAGFLRLARLRRRSRFLSPLPEAVRRMREKVGVFPVFRISEEVPSPVTYGIVEPTVLLQSDFKELDSASQEALACHELLHVRRRDWLFTVAEEFIRIVFWFHPAIWWLLERIQSSREQVVDREVVRVTASRSTYLEALLKMAANQVPLKRIPAPLFLRERQLARRVALMLEEVSMSRRKLVLMTTCTGMVTLMGGFLLVQALPLQGEPLFVEQQAVEAKERLREPTEWVQPVQAVERSQSEETQSYRTEAPQTQTATERVQTVQATESSQPEETNLYRTGAPEAQGEPIRIGSGVLAQKLIHRVDPIYPPEALQARVAGLVLVEAHVNEAGQVWRVRLLRGHPLLNQAAIEAVSQWRYSETTLNGQPVPVMGTVAVKFVPGETPTLTTVPRPLILHIDQNGVVWHGTMRLEGAALLDRLNSSEGSIELRAHPFLPEHLLQEAIQILKQAAGREVRATRGF